MKNFNARINNVRISNFNTKPQNLPQFQNPFLLLSDTEALNKILDGGVGTSSDRVPNPAGDLEMGGNVKSTEKPRSQMPTQSAERLARGAFGRREGDDVKLLTDDTETIHHNDPAIIAPTANRDNPSTSMPDRFPTGREGLFDNLSDDGESGDEGAHGGSGYVPANPNAPADEMGDEGHSEILTTQRTTSDGSTVHSGTGLLIGGKINSNVGLPTSMNSSLAMNNGKRVKEIKYNPVTNKFTLYYGNKLASGRYPSRVTLSPPDPPPKKRTILQTLARAVDGTAGANYMRDRLNSRSTRQP